ncbi:unnamed protein product [Urochloa humidicola]
MEPSNSSWRPHPPRSNSEKKNRDVDMRMQDLVVVRRPEVLRAARSGNLALLEEFLSRDTELLADEDAVYLEQATALHVVAASGDDPGHLVVADFICRKAEELLVACNGDGDTPLHCAALAGNYAMVCLLISQASVDRMKTMLRMQNELGETALHKAVRFGGHTGLRMVNVLLCHDRELARLVANDGTSPLYLATSMRDYSIAREVLSQGKELAYSGPNGLSALHPAVLHSRGMTAILLEWNKDLAKQSDKSGSTPMHFAASADNSLLEFYPILFLQRTLELGCFGIHFSPAMSLFRYYRLMKHPLCLLADVDPSSAFRADAKGMFPVHVAASAGNQVAVIILLIMCPGCAGLCDSQGRTFLHIAVERKNHDVVKFVSWRPEFKFVLNIQDCQGNTALHLAIRGGYLDIFQSLITSRYVRVNLPNKDGHTPMDLAQSHAPPGFYFGLNARHRILSTLTYANAPTSNRRRDQFRERFVKELENSEWIAEEESKKITESTQIVGIGSVLVATASFAAAFTMPGGFRNDDRAGHPGEAGTPMMAGKYAFDGFVISNTLAFICSTIATFSLVFCGIAAVDIEKRIKLFSFSLSLLLSAARSFCAAFAFALYLLLAPVAHGIAITACVMTALALALLDGLCFTWMISVGASVVLKRRVRSECWKLGAAFLYTILYLFWPYVVIFGLLGDTNIITRPLVHILGQNSIRS